MELSKAEKKKKDRRKIKTGRMESRILYVVGVLGLAALIACAFYLPRLIFSVGDNRLCSDIVLGEREDMDVTLLSAAYEPSLGVRLQNFVDGLARGRNYYFSEQDIAITRDLYQLLENDSDSRIFQQPCWAMNTLGLMSHVCSLTSAFYSVHSWKQYVIYSDDFAESVNFIVWYMEIEDYKGGTLNILMDAEDYTIYGLTTRPNPTAKIDPYSFCLLMEDESRLYEWGLAFRYYYQCLPDYIVDNQNFINLNQNRVITYDEAANIFTYANYTELENIWTDGEMFEIPDEDTCIMRLPCGTQYLDYSIRLLRYRDDVDSNVGEYSLSYIGLDDLCRLIPEFAETL